jgi:hypothetical protein
MSFSNKCQNERVFATENVTIILATSHKNCLMARQRFPQSFGVTVDVIACGDAIQLLPLAPEVNPELCYLLHQLIGHLKVFQLAEVLIHQTLKKFNQNASQLPLCS